MSTFATLRDVYAAGVLLWSEDGSLRYRAAGPLLADLAAALAANKPAILALLTEQVIGQHDGYHSPGPRRYLVPPGCIAPGACHRLGPCAAFLAGTPPCGLAPSHKEAA